MPVVPKTGVIEIEKSKTWFYPEPSNKGTYDVQTIFISGKKVFFIEIVLWTLVVTAAQIQFLY